MHHLTEVTLLDAESEEFKVHNHHHENQNQTDQFDPGAQNSELVLDKLYPVLVQTFVIIIVGYASGRRKIIGSMEAKGLNTFVGTFALPCLIFISLAELDFQTVDWNFLLSVCVAKTAVFFLVLVTTLIVTRPTDLSRAGLFAIFCTQSNDFALGYPILKALYQHTHPEYASYLYVIAPISLVFLNPIGFIFLELGKRNKSRRPNEESANSKAASDEKLNGQSRKSSWSSRWSSKYSVRTTSSTVSLNSKTAFPASSGWQLFITVWKNMLMSPAVFMTVLGMSANFLFQHHIPLFLRNIFEVFGSAFSATALFALGLRMVGQKQSTIHRSNFVVASILIGVKCLVMPILTREVTIHLQPNNDTLDLGNLGFLLGTFPTAPGVFFYAAQYNVAADLIATAMVACTFVSAPLMFVSARMLSLSSLHPSFYIDQLHAFLLPVSILGLLSTACMLIVFVVSKKWKKTPHFATMGLMLSQFIACVGVLLWYTLGRDAPWKIYLQFMVFAVGVFSSRLWTAILSFSLLLLRKQSLWFVLRTRPFLAAIGWGVPIIIATILSTVICKESDLTENPNFQYGKTQAFVATTILVFSFSITIICLVLQQRYGKQTPNSIEVPSLNCHPTLTPSASVMSFLPHRPLSQTCSVNSIGQCSLAASLQNIVISNGSSPPSSRRFVPPPLSRSSSILLQETFQVSQEGMWMQIQPKSLQGDTESLFSPTEDAPPEYSLVAPDHQAPPRLDKLTDPEESFIVRDRDNEFQILRHVLLLLSLCCSMFVGIALCVWTLVMEDLTGIYVILLFLDETLNLGQGCFVFAFFGFDRRVLALPYQGLNRLFRRKKETETPEDASARTNSICDQFMTYHMDKCVRDLVRDRRWHLKHYRGVFCGNELVDWLLLMGLARSRAGAVGYGRQLINGALIKHVDGQRDFYDQAFFYSFTMLEGNEPQEICDITLP